MRKTDIVKGGEYFEEHGRTYSYGQHKVVVVDIGVSGRPRWELERIANEKTGFIEKTKALKERFEKVGDITRVEYQAQLKTLEVERNNALALVPRYFKPAKGGQLLVDRYDITTYQSTDGAWLVTGTSKRQLLEPRDLSCPWEVEQKRRRETTIYQAKQKLVNEAAASRRAAERVLLKKGLAQAGVTGGYYEDGVEFDRTYGKTEVSMTRAALAKLLGVTLPSEDDKEEVNA
jgi:hypothetical protein